MKKNYLLSIAIGAFVLVTSAVKAQAPANNNCSGAKMLTVSSDTTCNSIRDSLKNATESKTASDCSASPSTTANDVWYSFVAKGPNQLIRLTPDSVPLVAVLYSSCNSAEITCTNPNFLNIFGFKVAQAGPTSMLAQNLTQGNTYYLRVYQYTGQFNTAFTQGTGFTICATTPVVANAPANDLCANAQVVTPSADTACANITNGTCLGATSTAAPENCDGNNVSSAANDVWYKFTATAAKHIIDVNSTSAGMVVGLYSSCGGTVVTCTNPTFFFGQPLSGTTTVIANNLTAGNTYFVRIYGYNSKVTDAVDFTLCVHAPKPPLPNDLCSGAIGVVPSLTDTCVAPFNVNIDGANEESPATSCNSAVASSAASDVWYKFVANADAIDVEATTQFIVHDYGVAIEAYDSNNGTCGTLIDCKVPQIINGQSFPGQTRLQLFGLNIGSTYFVRLYPMNAANPANKNFDLCIHKDSSSTTGINTVSEIAKSVNIFPNPANNNAHLSFTANSAVSIKIVNVTGTLVYTENFGTVNGRFEKNIDLSNFAKGIYIVQLVTDKESVNIKMVKE